MEEMGTDNNAFIVNINHDEESQDHANVNGIMTNISIIN